MVVAIVLEIRPMFSPMSGVKQLKKNKNNH